MIVFSRGTAFALCLSQVAVMGGAIMFWPPVRVEVYTAKSVNGTSAHLSAASMGLGLPFLGLSCLAVVFSTLTSGFMERGVLHQDNHYTFELLPELGPWDVVFWLFCGLAHALVVTVILSPADLYAVLLASLLLFYFLGRICSPRGAQLSMTQENTNLLGYCAGLLVVTYNVPDSRTGREGALLVTILLDYLLGVGHTWDANPTMDVVTNCRRSLPPLLRVQRVPLPGAAAYMCGPGAWAVF